MKNDKELLKEANGIIRSFYSVIKRKGETTNWNALQLQVKRILKEQHELKLFAIPDVIKRFLAMEIEVLYHGTKFKKTADKILKEGFKDWSYFATDLNTAIGQGGKYVFEVAFLKIDLPSYWQLRCEHKITPDRIIRMCKYEETELFRNNKLQDKVFDNAFELGATKPYCFSESGALANVL